MAFGGRTTVGWRLFKNCQEATNFRSAFLTIKENLKVSTLLCLAVALQSFPSNANLKSVWAETCPHNNAIHLLNRQDRLNLPNWWPWNFYSLIEVKLPKDRKGMWRRGRERAKDLEKHGSDGEMRKMKVNYCCDIQGKKATAQSLTRGRHDQDGTLPSTFLGSLWETGGMGREGGRQAEEDIHHMGNCHLLHSHDESDN